MTLKTDDFDIETYSDSDDGGEVEHKRLLAAISKLDKRKRVLPSERREPSLQVSEFHLTKDGSSVNNAVHLRDLAKSLGVKASHGELARKLKAAQRKAKTLPKPLEKPVANKIKREVAYENTIKQLDEWDPVVLKNRVSDNLVFPLKNDKPTKHNPEYFLGPGQGANELEREIAAVLNDSPSVQQEREENEEFSLSLEEMIQRRKELARLKAQESYRLAKAHRQNKIKSKKYHRFARRERIRQQIKEFEELQQKDPEAALQRLEEIEKERVLERASLRHRSTGQWARNQAVRAKYDKESRQVLAEQLKLSKDLTQKVVVESESSDDEPELVNGVHPSDNPWMSEPKTEEEIDTFLSGYRQYWDERNKSEQKGSDVRNLGKELGSINLPEKVKNCGSEDAMEEALLKSAVVSYTEVQGNGIEGLPQPSKLARGSKPQIGIKSSKTRNATSPSSKTKSSITAVGKRGFLKAKQSEPSGIASPSSHKQQNLSQAPRQGEEKKKDKNYVVWTASGKWVVTPTKENNETNANSLDDLFDDLSDKIAGKAKKKLSILMRDINAERPRKDKQSKKNSTKKRKAKNLKASKLLQMKKPRMQVDFDEKLEEGTNVDSNPSNAQNLADIIELSTFKPTENKKSTKSLELDPTKFMKIGPIQLPTELPDEITGGDEGLDDSDTEKDIREKQMTISEAFADDDVVADFRQEKQEAIDKSKPEDISLHLPGWGEWSGFNMKSSNRKRKRFIVKMPEPPPRRDENKGNLIINESEDAAARSHQVSELPFPFTSVKDFEASVRAPVSNTFIPESAHRKLIRPPIRTKIGAVIEPINKDVLMKHKKNVK